MLRFRSVLISVTVSVVAACLHTGFVHAQDSPDNRRVVCTLESSALRDGIRNASIAIGQATTKYRLDRGLIEIHKDFVRLVTTDGVRMALVRIDSASSEAGVPSPVSILVSDHGLKLIEEVLEEESGSCKLTVSTSELTLAINEAVVRFPAAKGRFPDWEKVWKKVLPPEPGSKPPSLKRDALLAAVVRAAPRTNSHDQGIDFRFENGRLRLSTTDQRRDSVELPLAFKGRPTTTRLDARLVIEFLRVLSKKEHVVSLSFQNAQSAVLFSTESGYLYLVMPIADE